MALLRQETCNSFLVFKCKMEERESARTPQKCLIIDGSFAERDLQLVPHFEVQDGRERERAPQKSPIIDGSFAERDLQLVPHFEVQDERERARARRKRAPQLMALLQKETCNSLLILKCQDGRESRASVHARERERERGRREKYCNFRDRCLSATPPERRYREDARERQRD